MTGIEEMFASILRPMINIITFTPTEEILILQSSNYLYSSNDTERVVFN